MKYWIYRDGLQRGPFTIEELADMDLTPDTPVWYEGLDNWITADRSPGLQPLLASRYGRNSDSDVEYSAQSCDSTTVIDSDKSYAPHESYRPADGRHDSADGGECPPTYLFWSILSTICCCLPLGIAAIIFSGKVKPCWQNGDIRGARKASETAQILIILSITISVFSLPLAFLM